MIENISNQAQIEEIKEAIKKRFGTVFNLKTGEMEKRPYDQINLVGHCREVSEKVQSVVGGEQIIKQLHGDNPEILYDGAVIADGHTVAIHAFVVKDGKVWDPITDNWGDS